MDDWAQAMAHWIPDESIELGLGIDHLNLL